MMCHGVARGCGERRDGGHLSLGLPGCQEGPRSRGFGWFLDVSDGTWPLFGLDLGKWSQNCTSSEPLGVRRRLPSRQGEAVKEELQDRRGSVDLATFSYRFQGVHTVKLSQLAAKAG